MAECDCMKQRPSLPCLPIDSHLTQTYSGNNSLALKFGDYLLQQSTPTNTTHMSQEGVLILQQTKTLKISLNKSCYW